MPFAIVADLPLGTYRGSSADGNPERIPSVSRLYSALLSAAGFGPRAAQRTPESLDVSDADEAVLRWLEHHPPTSVRIPALAVNVGNGAAAYRDDGTLKKDSKSGTWAIKKPPKVPNAGTAVDGTFAWIWEQAPPEPVRIALEQLCPDVAYLGTSESPVRLTAMTGNAFEATLDRDLDASLFTTGATGIELPIHGRLEELSGAHHAATMTVPSAAKDRYGTDEKSLAPVPPRKFVETAWYTPRQASSGNVPWAQVIMIPISQAIPDVDRVKWAIALHKALIKALDFGAPPMITGAYPDGVRPPANRVALHFLDESMPALPDAIRANGRTSWLAVLVPDRADAADLDALRRALTEVRSLQGKRLWLFPREAKVLDGSQFWNEPEPGQVRLWRTAPAAIPDTRGSRDANWHFTHAALLSLGFVWQDQERDGEPILPKVPGPGTTYYRGLAKAVNDVGVVIVHARAVRTSDVNRYVHKINKDAVVRPYTAVLSLGGLPGLRTIQAMGQSRHLGGGLLVPLDIPEGTRAGDIVIPGAGGE
jgi:CRISPR-associated protein Csb2